MGLSASMYSGITGLQTHGERMSVVGNNIANVNTIGFKSARMYFEDVSSQDIPTAAGTGQVGRGVRVSAVYADYSQGSFQNTNEVTDVAIGGKGFFMVSVPNEDLNYYTRAGNFRFDKDGKLVDAHGYVVQGWAVDTAQNSGLAATNLTSNNDGVRIKGTPTDIRMENFQSPPQATSEVQVITNLDSAEESRSNDVSDPFFAMFKSWNGTAETPLGQSAYAYQDTNRIYDENGTSHLMTCYFDPVTVSNSGGKQVWEFMVTVQPSDDGRLLNGQPLNQSAAGGVLAMGTITFNGAGQMENMSCFTLKSDADPTKAGGLKNLSNWSLSNFSQNGYPIVTANFLSVSNGSFTNQDNSQNIELNFGLRNKSLGGTGYTKGWSLGGGGTMSNAGQYSGMVASGSTINNLPSYQDNERGALATTAYSQGSTTLFHSQNGYTAGFLQNMSIDRDGVITGRYSNGQVLELFVITLANFQNNYGLRREGGNIFSETRTSGPPITNRPNTAGLGSVASNTLEQSNVDLATEFVEMITTQRGYQANSKVITTTDSMLGELIQLKR